MELMTARLRDLVPRERLDALPADASAELLFEHLYWRHAIPVERPAVDRAMILDFEGRYLNDLRNVAILYQQRNLAARFAALRNEGPVDPAVVRLLRKFDHIINRGWRSVHHQLALELLASSSTPRASTGGTDWCRYLSDANTHIRFFPELFGPALNANGQQSR
jgi:tryptophan 2,3-dioxygenase